ncbi:MAG: peroxiredoxin [Elusimicrobia bacterium]|nr:peroxiredoxin [Elusimicrobiota bacterium]
MSQSLVQKDAPDFIGQAVVDGNFKEIKLADYQGKWLVLFFYPLDFTFVCPTEITAFDEALGEFKKLGAEVVGCSVDSKYSHLAWTQVPRKNGGLGPLGYPLLADLTKKVAADYGVLTEAGLALRGLFVINPKGKVAYQVVHDLGVGRSVQEVLRVIAAFQENEKTGEVCPANWKPGAKTIKPNPQDSKEYFALAAKD